MPNSVYNDLGGMDEKYFLHVEDVDFCMRVERAGGTILYDPNVKGNAPKKLK
jgi:GT2 family glycosyltransferase